MVVQPSIAKESIVTWEPIENIQQPSLAAALTDALGAAGKIQPEMLIGSNFGLAATIKQEAVIKVASWFLMPQMQPATLEAIRRSGRPNLVKGSIAIVMEFLSEEDGGELSVRSTPPYGKLHFYEQILQVPMYVTYDPYEVSLEVRSLQAGRYALQTPDANGRFWIPQLQLFLGIWHGERLCQTINWLRWWNEAGDLLLWSAEQAEQERQRAEQERSRADRLAAKLRELGVDPDAIA